MVEDVLDGEDAEHTTSFEIQWLVVLSHQWQLESPPQVNSVVNTEHEALQDIANASNKHKHALHLF